MSQQEGEYRFREQTERWGHRSHRLEVAGQIIRTAIVAAAAVGIVHELLGFAGKHTVLSLSFRVTVSISVAGVVGLIGAVYKVRDQRKELLRLRAEKKQLEDEIGALKAATPASAAVAPVPPTLPALGP